MLPSHRRLLSARPTTVLLREIRARMLGPHMSNCIFPCGERVRVSTFMTSEARSISDGE